MRVENYKECLTLAGALVIDYKEFGSYQGDWIAFVEYKSRRGFVKDCFGSCSGCDAFRSEFESNTHNCKKDEYYNPHVEGYVDGCDICVAEKQKVIKFGEDYLENILTYEQAILECSRNITWDSEAQEMVKFIEKYRNEI